MNPVKIVISSDCKLFLYILSFLAIALKIFKENPKLFLNPRFEK